MTLRPPTLWQRVAHRAGVFGVGSAALVIAAAALELPARGVLWVGALGVGLVLGAVWVTVWEAWAVGRRIGWREWVGVVGLSQVVAAVCLIQAVYADAWLQTWDMSAALAQTQRTLWGGGVGVVLWLATAQFGGALALSALDGQLSEEARGTGAAFFTLVCVFLPAVPVWGALSGVLALVGSVEAYWLRQQPELRALVGVRGIEARGWLWVLAHFDHLPARYALGLPLVRAGHRTEEWVKSTRMFDGAVRQQVRLGLVRALAPRVEPRAAQQGLERWLANPETEAPELPQATPAGGAVSRLLGAEDPEAFEAAVEEAARVLGGVEEAHHLLAEVVVPYSLAALAREQAMSEREPSGSARATS